MLRQRARPCAVDLVPVLANLDVALETKENRVVVDDLESRVFLKSCKG